MGAIDKLGRTPERGRLREIGLLERLRNLEEAVRTLHRGEHLASGDGMLMRGGAGAVVFSREPGPPARKHDYWPFDVIPIYEGGSWWVQFWPGTLNGCFPTNMTTKFNFPSSEAYAKLCVTGQQNGTITNLEIAITAEPPAFTDPTKDVVPPYFEIGVGFFSNPVYRRAIGTGSLWAVPKVCFATPKANPAPWGVTLDRWWTWQIGTGRL